MHIPHRTPILGGGVRADRFQTISPRVVEQIIRERCRFAPLPEGERVRLGARLEERDLKRPLMDGVALSHELVQPAVPEEPVPILVDVLAVRRPG